MTEPDSPAQGRSNGLLFLILGVLAVGVGTAVWFAVRDGGAPEQPATDTVTAETVEQFDVGVASLDIGEDQRAGTIFEALSDSLPSEPAVWADLGLARLRLNQLSSAREALAKAAVLAPGNEQITLLQARVEERSGNFERAIKLLKQLPRPDPAALYMLAELVQRTGEQTADRERLALIERILERRPKNLVAQFERARLAAKLQDVPLLSRSLDALATESEAWSQQARELFDVARKAAEAKKWHEAATSLAFLQNVTKPTPGYQQSLSALGIRSGNTAGTPLRTFLKLHEPQVLAAEADEGLTFQRQPPSIKAARPGLLLAFPFSGKRRSTLLSLSGKMLQVGTSAALRLSRPSAEVAARRSLLAVDLNGDFREDLVLIGPAGLSIFMQQGGPAKSGNLKFTPFTPADTARPLFARPGDGVWALDFDADGDLDLLVAGSDATCQLVRNNGDMTFTPLETFSKLPAPRDLLWADFDGDGDGDVALLDRRGRLLVAWNERGGKYSKPTEPLPGTSAVAIAVGDVDHRGPIDLLLLESSGTIRRLSRDADHRKWESGKLAAWDGAPDLKTTFAQDRTSLYAADLDNNGGIDVVASAGTHSAIWLSHAKGEYRRLKQSPALFVTSVADLDGDGRLDLVGMADDGGRTALNRGTKNYRWQAVQPRANPNAGDKRINSFGLGGRIEIRAGRLVQTAPITSPRVHFGLGNHKRVAVARIVWPNGVPQAEFDLKADNVTTAVQRLKGSCPFLFARNGDRLLFVKDFIWRSPLGLKINSQETAGVNQTEDRVKIPGRFLSARDGRYDVRITAELWETHFFDHVSLAVVDHPPSVEVFLDERFVAARAPEQRVRAVAPPRPLRNVRDESGRDVSRQLRAIDGLYVDSFPLGRFQGVAKEHWVEFELDKDLPSDRPLLLVGHGWIYPTDSSLNVAMSQGKFPRPHGLILEVPDRRLSLRERAPVRGANGNTGWQAVSGDLGFPAGKNKTVLLPLPAKLLAAGQRRFRLRTNMEVYWDFLGFSAAVPHASLKTVRVKTRLAELRNRGFSEMSPVDRRRPDIPRYDRLATTGRRWRDLQGYYTRFGDVRELLQRVDDRYVIMNAGDELVLQFEAPPPPPNGWARDFVLIGDGWVKDGDFNTTHSRTVRPLPAHGQTDYAGPAKTLCDDPVYRRHRPDWERFHTRYITPRDFEQGLRRGIDR